MHKLIAIVLALLAVPAWAVTVSWANPVQNTDNSPIPATGPGALKETRIEWGSCTGSGSTVAFGTKAGETKITTPATQATVTLNAGRYCFRAFAVNAQGVDSDPSSLAEMVIYKPKPPSNIVVTVVIAP